MKKIIASRKLEKGPAAETIASSLKGRLKLLRLIGTGFAQPIIKKPERKDINGRIIEPIKSKCFIGFKVYLPACFAVESPNFSATNACANS